MQCDDPECRGWVHMDDSMGRGPGIEACDVCDLFLSDEDADVEHHKSGCCDLRSVFAVGKVDVNMVMTPGEKILWALTFHEMDSASRHELDNAGRKKYPVQPDAWHAARAAEFAGNRILRLRQCSAEAAKRLDAEQAAMLLEMSHTRE